MTQSSTKRNQSISKAIQIIEVMAAADGPMRLQDIGKAVRLPASTVLRFLKTRGDHEYVEQNAQSPVLPHAEALSAIRTDQAPGQGS